MEVSRSQDRYPLRLDPIHGKWGNLEARPNSILIVEQINSQDAEIIYAWEAFPKPNLEKGSIRGTAKVILAKNPRIEFGGGETARFVFEMQKDLKTVRKTSLFKVTYLTVTLKRINEEVDGWRQNPDDQVIITRQNIGKLPPMIVLDYIRCLPGR